jgi:hypothetical protein
LTKKIKQKDKIILCRGRCIFYEPSDSEDEDIDNFEAFYENLDKDTRINRYYIVLYFSIRVFITLIILFLPDYPVSQCCLCFTAQLMVKYL